MMDPDCQLSFKIFLNLGPDTKPEVRRFGIPQCNVTSYLFLRDKIRMMFPPLKNSTSNFKISWKDEDEDLIDITSDEELLIALTEMSGQEIRKLYVTILPNSIDDTHFLRGPTNSASGAHHAGVVCDNCAGPVHGYRYKCIQCPDFDLCAACEMQGAHNDHFMIRLSSPISLRSHFTKGLAHRLAKQTRKNERREGRSFRHCRFDEEASRERRTGEGCPANTWISNFLAQLSEMGGAAGAGFAESQAQGPQQEPQQHQQTFQQQQQPNQQQQPQQQQQQQKQQSQQSQTGRQYQDFPNCAAISELVNGIVDTCLTNVGPIVEKIVDPMMFNGQLPRDNVPPPSQPPTTSEKPSEKEKENEKEKRSEFMEPVIDLEVRFEDGVLSVSGDSFKTCEKSKETSSESSNQMDHSGSVCSDKEMRTPDDGKTPSEAEKSAPTMPPTMLAPPSGWHIPRDQSMEVDGWTVLTPSVSENAATGGQPASVGSTSAAGPSGPSSSEANQPQVVPVSAPVENLYPSLSPDARSKNPKVNESLDKMLSMGFTNSGGWLLRLLEQCNGEIEMVCQMLEPVAKQNQ